LTKVATPVVMNKYILFLLLLAMGQTTLANSDRHVASYVEQYRQIAVEEMHRTGIPASIKLAQAILESNAGRSELARRAKNHFGIKCGGHWDGPSIELIDDDKDDRGRPVKSCFRAYRHAEASFRAHSDFLTDPNKEGRYGFLFRYSPDDYVRWAHGLQKAGYATNGRYANLLIDLIRRYELDMYDVMTPDARDRIAGISLVNDIRVTRAKHGETPDIIAERTGTALSRLLSYNEDAWTAETPLPEGIIVYLQPRRNFYRGKKVTHKVRQGETMVDIARLYGVKTHKLRDKNRMSWRAEPLPGEVVRLRWRVSKEKVPRTRLTSPHPEDMPTPPSLLTPQQDPQVMADTGSPTSVFDLSPPASPPMPPAEEQVWHIVRAGDTLWSLSRAYAVPVLRLKSQNNLSSDHITVGQKLFIK
jgi:LysM repeat protein